MRELILDEITEVSGGYYDHHAAMPTGTTLRANGVDYYVPSGNSGNPTGFGGGSNDGSSGTITTTGDGATQVTWNFITSEITIEAREEGFFDLNNNSRDDDGLSTNDGVTSVVIDYGTPFNAPLGLAQAQYVNDRFVADPGRGA